MKKLIIIFTASIALLNLGCRKGFLDINSNPNASTVSKPEFVLSNALVVTAGRVDNPTGNFNFISGWMGYIAISGSYAISNSDFTTYKQTADFGEAIWQNQYDNITDYDYVAKSSKTTGQGYYQGIGLIMRSFNYQILVDLFNNVPYSEALQGTDNIHPHYDDAAVIYGDLFAKVDSAMTLINNAADAPDPKADLMFAKAYSENPLTPAHFAAAKTKWLQFANTFKLRMLERMSEMASKPAYFAGALAKVVADPNGFLTTDATVNPGYLNTAGKLSPFYGATYSATGTYTQDFYRANAFAIAFYQAHSDPRLPRVYTSVSGAYVGNTLGVQGAVGSASSLFGPGILSSYSQDAVIMLAAESFFVQAEAAARGWLPGGATAVKALYNQGVAESFRYLGVPNASTAAATYTSRANDIYTNMDTRTTAAGQITLIIDQKWIAENLINVFEPYCDYRRFVNGGITFPGTPAPPATQAIIDNRPLAFITYGFTPGGAPYAISQSPSVELQTGTGLRAIPYRLAYPRSELNTNAGNVPSGIDFHTSKIFWMP